MSKTNQSLLTKAKSYGTTRRRKSYEITSEHHELFKAFARGEINMKQTSYALGSKKNSDYAYLLAIAKDMAA